MSLALCVFACSAFEMWRLTDVLSVYFWILTIIVKYSTWTTLEFYSSRHKSKTVYIFAYFAIIAILLGYFGENIYYDIYKQILRGQKVNNFQLFLTHWH